MIALSRVAISPAAYADWGWRLPFLVSAILLIYSVWVRLKLDESPIFRRMKEEGKGSTSLRNSFLKYPNNKLVLLAILGATMGQGVIWYTGQFYALFFIQTTQQVDYLDLHDHGHRAAAGHPVLRVLRLAQRPRRRTTSSSPAA